MFSVTRVISSVEMGQAADKLTVREKNMITRVVLDPLFSVIYITRKTRLKKQHSRSPCFGINIDDFRSGYS